MDVLEKVIGVIVLAVLVLVCAAVLTVLFVPLILLLAVLFGALTA